MSEPQSSPPQSHNNQGETSALERMAAKLLNPCYVGFDPKRGHDTNYFVRYLDQVIYPFASRLKPLQAVLLVVLTLVVFVGLQLVNASVGYMVVSESQEFVGTDPQTLSSSPEFLNQLLAFISKTSVIVTLVQFLFFAWYAKYLKHYNVFSTKGTLEFGESFGKAFFVMLVLLYAAAMIGTFFVGQNTMNQQMIAMMFTPDVFNMIGLFLSLAILGPVVEELVFRYLLVGVLFRGSWIGIIISSVLFGYLHVGSLSHIVEIIPYFLMGGVLGYTYRRFKSIYLCIAIHVVNNIIAVSTLYVSMQMQLA